MFANTKSQRTSKIDSILLDSLNLFIAPLGGGAGAYVAYYFASCRHWNAGEIGFLLFIMALCLSLFQIPAGLIVDRISKRNQITAGALAVIAISWLVMLFYPAKTVVFIAQIMIGISCAFFGPAIASISLGLVGYNGLEARLGRSGVFSHVGNMLTAVMVGLCTGWLSGNAIIGLLVAFAIIAAISALGISKCDLSVNHAEHASLSQDYAEKFNPLLKGLFGLLNMPGAKIFCLAALMYTFANASMLPLMVQLISKQAASAASVQLPSALLLTELVMIPVCFFVGKHAQIGRRPWLIVSYLFLVLRGIGFTFIKSPAVMVSLQVLDGISAGIFGLVITFVVADYCRHNNRFSSTLAALYMILTLANGFSEFCSGLLASHFGFTTAFAILTLVGAVGLTIIVTLLPETRQKTEPAMAENTMPAVVSTET